MTGVETAIIVSIVVSIASSALTPKQKRSGLADFAAREQGINQLIRSSVEPQRVLYGERMVSGPLVFATTSGERNKHLHLVVALAIGPVEEIGEVLLNDVAVGPLDGLGDVTAGRFAGRVRIVKHLGAAGQLADADLVAVTPEWTSEHRLRGIAYLNVRLEFDRDVFPTGIPNIKALVKGRKLFDPRDSSSQWTDNAALALRDYLLADFGLNADVTSELDDTAAIAAANICDEAVALPAALPTLDFTADAAADDCTQVVASGAKPIPLHLGDGVQLTTTGVLPAGLALATTYYAFPKSATVFGLATTLSNARSQTALDLTDAGSGTHTLVRKTQPRYTVNGVLSLDARPVDIVPDLVGAMFGALSYAQGKYTMFAGGFTGPASVTLTESDLRARIAVRPRPGKADLHNAVRGTFTDRDANWQPTEFPVATNAAYEAADAKPGAPERIFKDIELANVTDTWRAQRLAKLTNERDRQGLIADFPAKLTALELAVMDTVDVTISQLGWAAKEFEVVAWRLAEDGGVDLTLKETAAAVYAWDPDADPVVVDLAPNTNLPSPFDAPPPPTDLVLDSAGELLLLGEGSVASRIRASWVAPDSVFVTQGGGVEVQAKRTSSADWEPQGGVPGDQTAAFIAPVSDGESWDVRVRSVNHVGVRSVWATVLAHVVIGKTAAPPDVDAFNITRQPDGTRRFTFSMTAVPADVRAGGGYRIRYESGASFDWATAPALHVGLLVSSPFETNELAAGTWSFGVKAIDSSGNESATALTITATIGDPRLREVLLSQIEEDLPWTGTLTDCFVTPSNHLLAAAGAGGDIAGLPATISGLAATIGAMGARVTPLRYETAVFDLGGDVSFTPVVSAEADGTATIEMRTHTSAEGSDVSSEAWIAVATVSAERYIQIRVSVAGGAPRLKSLVSLFDGETVVEDFEDVAVGSESAAWFERVAAGHFRIASQDRLAAISAATLRAIQNVGAGYSWELISKSATVTGNSNPAAEFKVYDSGNTLADATVDVEIKGPKA